MQEKQQTTYHSDIIVTVNDSRKDLAAQLKKRCRRTSMDELVKLDFVDRCKSALGRAWTPGVGIAAVQIGEPIQAAWFRVMTRTTKFEHLLFNPEVVEESGFLRFNGEGCLSIPDMRMTTERFKRITVKNGDGEIITAEDMNAVVLQHEIDHMHGVLCTDRCVMSNKMKPGRNDLCPCGSNKKYKKCCL
jgi:peptide deformylase